jgi:hypothetical protein
MTAEADLVATLQSAGARIVRFVPGISIAYQIDNGTAEKAHLIAQLFGFTPIRATPGIFEIDLLCPMARYAVPQQ